VSRVFFFQAEDGIRDRTVTGVQTCALPIYLHLARRGVEVVRLVAHGSSDAAASYGVYVFGLLPGWTAFRDSISLSTYYRAELDFSRSAVMALSQSGETPDVVSYLRAARERGALTVAVTNEPRSALAEAAEWTLG